MIIVTGAAGVLGQAVTRKLAEAGTRVAAIDVSKVIRDAGQAMSIPETNLTYPAATRATTDRVGASPEGITGLVNVAGGFRWEKVAEGSPGT